MTLPSLYRLGRVQLDTRKIRFLRSKVIVSAPKALADSTLKCSPSAMSSLATLWKGGREGTLSPLEQMKAWALREAQKDLGGKEAVCYKKIAERVTKIGGGHPGRALDAVGAAASTSRAIPPRLAVVTRASP